MAMRTAELTLRREDGRVVCESVRVADTTTRRLRGLLGRKSLPSGQGMLLRPAFSIHTWFMRFPIDVVFLDPEQVVIKIDPAVRPFKTSSCRGAREVVELTAGECERRGLGLGDRVAWAARSSWDAVDESAGALAAPLAPRQPSGAVLVVSTDPRFTKLIRFLLEGRDLSVAIVGPETAARQLTVAPADAVLIDAETHPADGLRLANALRVESNTPIVIARESGGPLPGGVPSFHKWDETEDLVAAVARFVLPDSEAEDSQ